MARLKTKPSGENLFLTHYLYYHKETRRNQLLLFFKNYCFTLSS